MAWVRIHDLCLGHQTCDVRAYVCCCCASQKSCQSQMTIIVALLGRSVSRLSFDCPLNGSANTQTNDNGKELNCCSIPVRAKFELLALHRWPPRFITQVHTESLHSQAFHYVTKAKTSVVGMRERSGCVNSPLVVTCHHKALFIKPHTPIQVPMTRMTRDRLTIIVLNSVAWHPIGRLGENMRELTLMMWAMQQSSHQSTEYGWFGGNDGIPKHQNETFKSWLRDDILRKCCEWQYRLRKPDINRTLSPVGCLIGQVHRLRLLWLSSGLMESWGEL